METLEDIDPQHNHLANNAKALLAWSICTTGLIYGSALNRASCCFKNLSPSIRARFKPEAGGGGGWCCEEKMNHFLIPVKEVNNRLTEPIIGPTTQSRFPIFQRFSCFLDSEPFRITSYPVVFWHFNLLPINTVAIKIFSHKQVMKE